MSMEVDNADVNTERFPTEAEVIGKSGIVYKVRVVEWIKNSNSNVFRLFSSDIGLLTSGDSYEFP